MLVRKIADFGPPKSAYPAPKIADLKLKIEDPGPDIADLAPLA